MRQTGTYQDLTDLERDINIQANQSPIFTVFNRDKIKRFFQENKQRLTIVKGKIDALMERHVHKDEKGVFKQKIKPEGQPNSWDFKSDEDQDAFQKAMEELMSKTIEIYL